MVRNTIAGSINPNKKTGRKTVQKIANISDKNDQRPRAGVVGAVDSIDADLGIPL